MSKIFELFGYRFDTWGPEAEANCAKAWCPFMDAECDGGGNRYLSAVNLHNHPELAEKFPGKQIVQAGICSIQIRNNEHPWIICPRRLLFLKKQPTRSDYQRHTKEQLANFMTLSKGTDYRVWSEVKMKVGTSTNDEQEKFFDYTFDYIIAGSRKIRLSEVAAIIGRSERVTRNIAEKNGFTLTREGDLWINDFPSDPVIIVEVMTSSTSGGDKKKRTQIGMALEDALLYGEHHNGPGINYRQVWARMVSQLIVKSQVGLAWNGKTIWFIQDILAKYISSSTALDLSKYLSDQSDEVNILTFGYGNVNEKQLNGGIVPLQYAGFYAGPITGGVSDNLERGGFIEIVKIGAPPPKELLWKSLFIKAPCATFSGS